MIQNKKDDHVKLAQEFHGRNSESHFDKIRFVHKSLSHVDLDQVDTSTSLAGIDIEYPFFINAMTGGSSLTGEINRKLAIVARETGIPIASGSLSVAMKDPSLLDSFRVIREENPDGIVLANLGAEHSIENAKKAIDILEAQALQIHLNTPQELVMPEGDRDFSHWLPSIEYLAK